MGEKREIAAGTDLKEEEDHPPSFVRAVRLANGKLRQGRFWLIPLPGFLTSRLPSTSLLCPRPRAKKMATN